MVTFDWRTTAEADGVREREFRLGRGERNIPGILWDSFPAATEAVGEGPRPMVVIGHGASGTKREGYVVALARRLVRHAGVSAVAIDGPVHGDRVGGGARSDNPFLDFGTMWMSDPTMTDEMIGDWVAVLDALAEAGEADPAAVGYWGLSMGTILGLPLVAAEPRISVAVLGLIGLGGPTVDRLRADAARLTCPVLFLLQLNDELFDAKTYGIALFDAIGSPDKRLHVHPGRHGDVPREAFDGSERFLTDRLAPGVGTR
jgi:dienelactone hydrolase